MLRKYITRSIAHKKTEGFAMSDRCLQADLSQGQQAQGHSSGDSPHGGFLLMWKLLSVV